MLRYTAKIWRYDSNYKTNLKGVVLCGTEQGFVTSYTVQNHKTKGSEMYSRYYYQF